MHISKCVAWPTVRVGFIRRLNLLECVMNLFADPCQVDEVSEGNLGITGTS
jgi:hypothetical protein